jgi:hypothetical protein
MKKPVAIAASITALAGFAGCGGEVDGTPPASAHIHGVLNFEYEGIDTHGFNSVIGVVGGGPSVPVDDQGRFDLVLPVGATVTLAVDPGALEGQVVVEVPSGGREVDLATVDVDGLVGMMEAVNAPVETGGFGVVAVRFHGAPDGGYRASIGAASGGSLVLGSAGVLANPESAMKGATTLGADGAVLFFGVTPGTTKVTAVSPGGEICRDQNAPGTTSYPVADGALTQVDVQC